MTRQTGASPKRITLPCPELEIGDYQWLLLLDQDTVLSLDFFSKLVECASTVQAEDHIAAIVPKLIVQGIILSPAEHFVDYIRNQFRRSGKMFGEEPVGIQLSRMSAYNSGTTLSVPAMRALSGFPEDFWLDYLDHAIFHLLYTNGYRVYVMDTVIAHDLAESNLNERPLWRFRNMLDAQTRFIKRTGNTVDHLLYRIWLLRSVRRLRADVEDQRVWKETLRQAFFLKMSSAPDAFRPPGKARPS